MKQIINCKSSECPQEWVSLTEGDNAFTKFCHICFKKVLFVEDSHLSEDYIKSGAIVATRLSESN
ncbi:MAG: hypothetical protein HN610_09105 [Verrucomicrobia bacterium]|nr:hypothetical protein [Verrucomicrobiota bacterium]